MYYGCEFERLREMKEEKKISAFLVDFDNFCRFRICLG